MKLSSNLAIVLSVATTAFVGCATEYPSLTEIDRNLQVEPLTTETTTGGHTPTAESQLADEDGSDVPRLHRNFVELMQGKELMGLINEAPGPVLIDFLRRMVRALQIPIVGTT